MVMGALGVAEMVVTINGAGVKVVCFFLSMLQVENNLEIVML